MMGWSPKCYVTSFVEISKLVQAKKIFKGFLPGDIWAWWPFRSCDPDLVLICQAVLEDG